MKKVISLFFILILLKGSAQTSDSITVAIEYDCNTANEVYLVWGVNGWNTPDPLLVPQGSEIKSKLLHSPMKKKSGVFHTSLRVPANTMIDFVFRITKGPMNRAMDIWDVNLAPQKDFHLLALCDQTTGISPTVSTLPKEQPNILDFSLELFVIAGMLTATYFTARRYFFNRAGEAIRTGALITSVLIVTVAAQIATRASVSELGWNLYLAPAQAITEVTAATYQDILLSSTLALIFTVLLYFSRHRKRLHTSLKITFCISAAITILTSILNIKVVESLGKPFTWQWFYYSDFLQSADAKAALSANISKDYFSSIFVVMISLLMLAAVLSFILNSIFIKLKSKGPVLASIPLALVPLYLFLAPQHLASLKSKKERLQNPVTAFLASVNPFASRPSLFTMKTEEDYKKDFTGKKANQALPYKSIKNVIVFVMESTPAEYVEAYNAKYSVTPELNKRLQHALVFKNIYAHAPATNNSMVSLLGSVYPWISYNSITREYPDIQIPTITSELKQKGYRTAFFNSADNRFQKAGEFLSYRNMDEIRDCQGAQCERSFEVENEQWNFLNGKDDECTKSEMTSWIAKDTSTPFFAMMWTYQTHYPYFISGREEQFSTQDHSFNRYLNAVKHSDKVFGEMMNELARMNLLSSTLVIVIGDHGEAFGRHNQTTHASHIYEENIHIPCILIHPSFKYESLENAGGVVDIAPTVMNVLGYKSSKEWQGSSLFSKSKNDRVYFFTPWGDYQFGYREGNMKYIYNASTNETEVYDLNSDCFETKNLEGNYADKKQEIHGRLAAWTQWHTEYLNEIIRKNKKK